MSSKRKSEIAGRPRRCSGAGFALIAALGIMSFLVLLGVALYSLASVSLSVSEQATARVQARANAKMALAVALGELQEAMGPDKRISARADILDTDPSTEEADNVAHPHYLGVWDSWDTWLTDQRGSLSIQGTYNRETDPGRHSSLFRQWLVSYPDDLGGSDSNSMDLIANALDPASPDVVYLCGEGSAGPDTSDHVLVQKLDLNGDGGSPDGRYAWWVSDDSQKARINLESRELPSTISEAAVSTSQTGRMGIETLPNMQGFDTDSDSIAKLVSVDEARITADGVSENFHALTAHSLGLLTDVRSGGFKTDLNLAFEAPVPPAEMGETELFNNLTFDAPIRPFNGELANITPNNPYIAPMSWRSLRDYYRLYREFPGESLLKPLEWSGNTPLTNRLLMREQSSRSMWDAAGYNRDPILLRQTWILATMTENDPQAVHSNGRGYYLLAIPVITLWNPYNVPLEVESTEISTFGTMHYSMHYRMRVYRDGVFFEEIDRPEGARTSGNNNYFGRDSRFTPSTNHDITSNQAGYRMIPTDNNIGTIRFEPGEVRIFSSDDLISGDTDLYPGQGMSNRHFVASPGYTPAGTSVGSLRGLSWRIDTGNTAAGNVTFSLRLDSGSRQNDKFYFGASQKSVHNYYFQEFYGDRASVYKTDGSRIEDKGYHDVLHLSAINLDWLEAADVANSWIIEDNNFSRAGFPAPGEPPLPVGIVSITAKTADLLDYTASGSFSNDFRNRSWLHAPLTQTGGSYIIDPGDPNEFDKLRADAAYQVHFTAVNGDVEVSQYLEEDGRNGFFGGGMSASNGQKFITAQDLPIAPVRNLGDFSGVRVAPARTYENSLGWNQNLKRRAISGAAFGTGVGNGYAHPMIEPESVYTKHDFGVDPGWNGTRSANFAMHDDYWDHLFLSNEALWDSWFSSGIAPDVNMGTISSSTMQVAENFLNGLDSPVPNHYRPYLADKTVEDIINDVVSVDNASEGENGWDLIASHILNKGQFNVNSTSKAAWKALLMSMAERAIGSIDDNGSVSVIPPDTDAVTFARHPITNSDDEASGPSSSGAWNGIRKLTEGEVDKLAEEIVRQVKLRGPFLNMADFINRRLTDDDTGVTGALQAAIDWDEFNSGYDGNTSGGSGESINEAYKSSIDMIKTGDLPADYPNEMAASGSRYAGIPGYVMQSDILQGIGNSIAVRGDTFTIRAYGEMLDEGGDVTAKAWCEAVIQRLPEYVDPADDAAKKMRFADQLPNDNPSLQPANERFGRRFEITSFRWLNENEI